MEEIKAKIETERIHADSQEKEELHQLVSDALQSMIEITEESNESNRKLSKTLSQVDGEVSVSGTYYSSKELAELGEKTKTELLSTWNKITDTFYVSTIRLPGAQQDGEHALDLSNEKHSYSKALLVNGKLSAEHKAILAEAISEKPIKLTLEVETKPNGEIGTVLISDVLGEDSSQQEFSEFE